MKAECLVGFYRIEALVLEVVSADLLDQADATAFLGKVDQCARALLADPKILILDEATSSLDSATEALLQSALDNLMRGRTSFVVAHRLSTIVKADQIVVLEKGEVTEVGTHKQLVKSKGLYSRLYHEQFRVALQQVG